MKVYYPATPASDGTSMTPPSNAQFTVHELTDTTFSNPLPLESLAGTNAAPLTTTAQGVLPDVYVISDNYSHVFRSGQWQFRRDSFDGAQKATEQARQEAASAAGFSQASSEASVGAQQSALDAKSAAEKAAALVGAPADDKMAVVLSAENSLSRRAVSQAALTQYGAEYNKAKTGINALYEFDGIKPVDRDAAASTWKDSTAALQAAVNQAIAEGEELILPALGVGSGLLVNGGITVSQPLQISGGGSWEMKNAPGGTRKRQSGAVLLATEDGGGTPVLNFSPADAHMYGFGLRGVAIDGWSAGKRLDRPALAAERIHAEFFMENIRITGFQRQGIRFREVYDGTMLGTLVFTCGTEGSYAAFDIAGGNGNNSNAIHSYGLHIESSPFILRVADSSRHIQFDASKFETYSEAPRQSPIQITNAQEVVFNAPQLVYRNTDDRYFYASDDLQPHMMLVDGPTTKVTVSAAMASSPPYYSSTAQPNGARWFKSSNGARLKIVSGGQIDRVWGGGGQPGISLGDRGILLGNTVVNKVANGRRSMLALGAECVVDANIFEAASVSDANTVQSDGSVIVASGVDNTIGASNKFRLSASTNQFFIATATGPQHVMEMERRQIPLPSGTASPNVGWVDRGNSRAFSIGNPAPFDVVGFTGGQANDEITVQFSNANTRLIHGSAFKLMNGANVTPPVEKIMAFRFLNGVWYEMNRNF